MDPGLDIQGDNLQQKEVNFEPKPKKKVSFPIQSKYVSPALLNSRQHLRHLIRLAPQVYSINLSSIKGGVINHPVQIEIDPPDDGQQFKLT